MFGNRVKKNTSKKDQTSWLVRLNDIRNIAFHPEKGFVSFQDLQFLRAVDQWFSDRLAGRDTEGATIESILGAEGDEAEE